MTDANATPIYTVVIRLNNPAFAFFGAEGQGDKVLYPTPLPSCFVQRCVVALNGHAAALDRIKMLETMQRVALTHLAPDNPDTRMVSLVGIDRARNTLRAALFTSEAQPNVLDDFVTDVMAATKAAREFLHQRELGEPIDVPEIVRAALQAVVGAEDLDIAQAFAKAGLAFITGTAECQQQVAIEAQPLATTPTDVRSARCSFAAGARHLDLADKLRGNELHGHHLRRAAEHAREAIEAIGAPQPGPRDELSVPVRIALQRCLPILRDGVAGGWVQRAQEVTAQINAVLTGQPIADPRDELVKELTWQPIDTAPKGPSVRLWIPAYSNQAGREEHGHWDADEHSLRPRPFWNWCHHRTQRARDAQPSHWLPMADAPDATLGKGGVS